jgi:hypothetical protein
MSEADYETDLSAWCTAQAVLLRRRAAGERVNDGELDWLNLAEEIESLGRGQQRELRSRMKVLIQHLLKWHYQPALRSRSWRSTIATQREEIEDLLRDNPSLRPTLTKVLEEAYPAAQRKALEETGLDALPATSPFDAEQALKGELPPL